MARQTTLASFLLKARADSKNFAACRFVDRRVGRFFVGGQLTCFSKLSLLSLLESLAMFRPLLLPALLTCFGFCSTSLQAQYDLSAPPGMSPYGPQGFPAPSRCSGNNCAHGDYGMPGQSCSPGSACGHAHGAASNPMPYQGQFQPGQVQRPYGQFQPSSMMPQDYAAPPMLGGNASGCPHCQQGSAPLPGPQGPPNMAMPSPNYPRNRGPRGMNGPPSTFASVAPPQARNPAPSPDSHAGHDHANHNHGDHSHADHSHANPQRGDMAQDRPRLVGPVLAQPARGTAQILQNDSPLMSGGEQLGSIDRGQVLKIVNTQGNWVQLETNWLGKNAWIRKEHVQIVDTRNQALADDIAPPAN
jgi:hypothetical protein